MLWATLALRRALCVTSWPPLIALLCVVWRLTGRSLSQLLSMLPPLPLLLSHGSLPHFTRRPTSRHRLPNTIKMSYGRSIVKVGWSVHLHVAYKCVHAHMCTRIPTQTTNVHRVCALLLKSLRSLSVSCIELHYNQLQLSCFEELGSCTEISRGVLKKQKHCQSGRGPYRGGAK